MNVKLKILWILSLIAIITLFVIAFYLYFNTEGQVPAHVSFNGVVDRYGDNKNLFVLPTVCLMVSMLLFFLNFKVEYLNYPIEINDSNRTKAYQSMRSFLAIFTFVLNLVLLILYLSIYWNQIFNIKIVLLFLCLIYIIVPICLVGIKYFNSKRNSMLLLFISSNLILAAQTFNVNFNSNGFILEGTLMIPNTVMAKKPLIVFVHGSGPNDRDQTIAISGGNANCLYPSLVGDTIKNFKEIATYLSENGYATFRFDKRTFTHGSSIDPTTISPYDFIEDVEQAINFLKLRNDIDTNCISLLGHSQGGTLIPYIAAKRNDIKNLISLASPSRSIDSLYSYQIEYIYTQCGDSTTGYNQSQQSLDAFTQVRNDTWPANQPFNGAYPKFWKDWINLSDSVIYYTNQANIPNYFSFGEDDFNVPISDKNRFEDRLINDFELNTFVDMNHFLTSSAQGNVKNELKNSLLNWLDTKKCPTYVNLNSTTLDKFLIKNKENYLIFEFPYQSKFKMCIYNSLGQIILAKHFSDKMVTLEKAGLENNFYFVKVIDLKSNKEFRRKFTL